jgi:hypothetical protein
VLLLPLQGLLFLALLLLAGEVLAPLGQAFPAAARALLEAAQGLQLATLQPAAYGKQKHLPFTLQTLQCKGLVCIAWPAYGLPTRKSR